MPQPTKNLGIRSLKTSVPQSWLTKANAISLNPVTDTMARIPNQMTIVENNPKIPAKAVKVQ